MRRMQMKKQEFVLFPKRLSNGKVVYYYTIYTREKIRKQFSTGKTDKVEAMKVCIDRMASGNIIPNYSISFKEYTKNWFNYDESLYIQSRVKRGFSYSRSHADINHRFINNKAIPYFGEKSMKIISPDDLETFILKLKAEGLSNSTVNKAIKVFKLIFGEALRRHDIEYNPAETILFFKDDTKIKGIFSNDEVSKLFEGPNCIENYWNNNLIAYTINYLAVKTGMRIGEIQGLQSCDVRNCEIYVQHSWDSKYGLKGTKTGKSRIIPISEHLNECIQKVLAMQEDVYIFSINNGQTPISKQCIYENFYRALLSAGITRDECKSRNITFHSWRHTFASFLANDNVPELYIRELTGHRSANMLNHYTHIQTEKLKQYVC